MTRFVPIRMALMHFALNLKTVGELYYSCRTETARINELKDALWKEAQQKQEKADYEAITSAEIEALRRSAVAKLRRAMDITVDTRKELQNARLRLDHLGFDDEIGILDRYVEILSKDLKLDGEKVASIARDTEIPPAVQNLGLEEQLGLLFREIVLGLAGKKPGAMAVSGFTTRDGKSPKLLDLLNEMALAELGRMDTLRIVERAKLDAVLKEQEFADSDLADTRKAISVGQLLSATHILTGTVIEMSASVVIFGRVIDVESGEIESVSQIIVPKDADVKALL